MLAVRNLVVRYGKHTALDGVDLDVRDAEVLCVLGPSGSGKSTLLRAIAGLEPVAGGTVERDGIDIAGVPTHRRDLGLMFQDHALFPHRDVLGNVLFGLRMHGVARTDAEARARDALALVGLGGMERRGVRELSGGEQQRVALARALAPEPTLLMLDEPLGSLDRALREQLTEDLRALFQNLSSSFQDLPASRGPRARSKTSVLLVTHDHDEAFAIGDRVAVMAAGRIEQVGSPAEVWRRPATEFVARFLGWNVLPGLGPDGQHDRIAVRPDRLRIASDGELVGKIISRTFRRDHFRVRVVLDRGSATVEVAVAGQPPLPGTGVRLAVDADAVVRLPSTRA